MRARLVRESMGFERGGAEINDITGATPLRVKEAIAELKHELFTIISEYTKSDSAVPFEKLDELYENGLRLDAESLSKIIDTKWTDNHKVASIISESAEVSDLTKHLTEKYYEDGLPEILIMLVNEFLMIDPNNVWIYYSRFYGIASDEAKALIAKYEKEEEERRRSVARKQKRKEEEKERLDAPNHQKDINVFLSSISTNEEDFKYEIETNPYEPEIINTTVDNYERSNHKGSTVKSYKNNSKVLKTLEHILLKDGITYTGIIRYYHDLVFGEGSYDKHPTGNRGYASGMINKNYTKPGAIGKCIYRVNRKYYLNVLGYETILRLREKFM